jgi:ketosteroid isomerase-like protein
MPMSKENAKTVRGVRVELHPPSESASRRRTPDERLRVLLPALFRPLVAAFLRLPPRSRLRRLVLARAMTRAYAAANRRDFELILTSYDPGDYEYRPSADLLPPDFATVYRGHHGYLEFWRRWLDAFEDIRWDPEEILDLGGKALVTTRQSGHGSGSGVAVSVPVYQLFTFRRGLVMRQEDFLDRSKALEAAGLRD